MSWYPKASDLWPYIEVRMEEAYQQRERKQCSRDDFFDGYLSALRDFIPRSSFKPDRFEPEQDSESAR